MKSEDRDIYEKRALACLEEHAQELGISGATIEPHAHPNANDFDIAIRDASSTGEDDFIGVEVTSIGVTKEMTSTGDDHQKIMQKLAEGEDIGRIKSTQKSGRTIYQIDTRNGEVLGETFQEGYTALNDELCKIAKKKWEKVQKSRNRRGHRRCWLIVDNNALYPVAGMPGVIQGPRDFWEKIIVMITTPPGDLSMIEAKIQIQNE